jgi:putative ABC transport system permease protein
MRWPGLAVRLAARNLRRHPGQALLLLLTLTIATGVLGVAMSLYGSADEPWNRTWRATKGFHVSFTVYHPPDEPGDRALVASLRRDASQLTTAPGVVAVVGIPLGLGLWSLMEGGDLPAVRVSATSLVLLAAAVPVVFAAIVSVPARLLARRPVAPLLAYE